MYARMRVNNFMPKNAKRTSSYDVARVAGVSRATVSAYLNGSRYVSPELSKKIDRAVNKLKYIPDPHARALKMKDTKTIGLVIPVMSQFYTPMIRAINEMAHENKYGFLLSSSEEDLQREREVLEIMLAKRISGILLAPCSESNRKFIHGIRESGIPVVQVNRRIEGLAIDSVVSNNYQVAHRVTEQLIAQGRKRIVWLGLDPNSLANVEKKAGYESALRAHQLPEMTISIEEHNVPNIEAAFQAFLETAQPFDGLICTSQAKTAISVRLLRQYSIRVPQDVAVIAFDESPWPELIEPSLSVVVENTYEMGQRATRLLLNRMEGVEILDPQHIVLEDRLIIREST